MVEVLITVCLFLAFTVFREVQFAKEREKLMNRVQSSNLYEYKQAEVLNKPREKKEKPKETAWL